MRLMLGNEGPSPLQACLPLHAPLVGCQAKGYSLMTSALQGRAVLRGGRWVSKEDLVMRLAGVYVAEGGRLHARLHLVHPLNVHPPLDAADVANHTADYRWAPSRFRPISCDERPA